MSSKSLASDVFNGFARCNYDNVNSNNNHVPLACKTIMNNFEGPISNEYLTNMFGLKSSRFVGNICIQNGITYLKSGDKILNKMECSKYKCDKCGVTYPNDYCNGYCDNCYEYQDDNKMHIEKYQWKFSIFKSLLQHPGGIKCMITAPMDSQSQFIYKSLDYKDNENNTNTRQDDDDESEDDDEPDIGNPNVIISPHNNYDFNIRGHTRKNWRYNRKRGYICIAEENEEYDEPNPTYMSYGVALNASGIYAFNESSQ